MIIKIKTFSGETLYIPEEDYLDEIMYSDLEEREFTKNSIRYVKKLLKRGMNDGFSSLAKTGTPKLSKNTEARLLRFNNKIEKSVPKQLTISPKGIKKNPVRRLGIDPRVLKEAASDTMRETRQQTEYVSNFINNAPDRNKAIAEVRKNGRDFIKNGYFN